LRGYIAFLHGYTTFLSIYITFLYGYIAFLWIYIVFLYSYIPFLWFYIVFLYSYNVFLCDDSTFLFEFGLFWGFVSIFNLSRSLLEWHEWKEPLPTSSRCVGTGSFLKGRRDGNKPLFILRKCYRNAEELHVCNGAGVLVN